MRKRSRNPLFPRASVQGRFGHSLVTSSPARFPPINLLSPVGMLVFAKAFDHYVQSGPASVLAVTCADNWELVARSAKEFCRVFPVVERFLDLCHLIVAPSKCWFWATNLFGRRKLHTTYLLGQNVPVKLQAKELGADIFKFGMVGQRQGPVACLSYMVCRALCLRRHGFFFQVSFHMLCTLWSLLRRPKRFCRGCGRVRPTLLAVVPKVRHLGLPVCWPPTDVLILSLCW